MTFATPAFAEDGKGNNMGGKNAGIDPHKPSTFLVNPKGWAIGLAMGLYYHQGYGLGSIFTWRNFLAITSGQPPGSW